MLSFEENRKTYPCFGPRWLYPCINLYPLFHHDFPSVNTASYKEYAGAWLVKRMKKQLAFKLVVVCCWGEYQTFQSNQARCQSDRPRPLVPCDSMGLHEVLSIAQFQFPLVVLFRSNSHWLNGIAFVYPVLLLRSWSHHVLVTGCFVLHKSLLLTSGPIWISTESAAMSFKVLLVVFLGLLTLSSAKHWALLVAGSSDWWNYRHQVCAFLQYLLCTPSLLMTV